MTAKFYPAFLFPLGLYPQSNVVQVISCKASIVNLYSHVHDHALIFRRDQHAALPNHSIITF